MDTTELQFELHQIIDRIKDNQILKAVHTILSSQTNTTADTTSGKTLTNSQMDQMLQDSEIEIQNGQVISQKDLKEEIKNWRRK